MTLDVAEGVMILALCVIIIAVLINILIAVRKQAKTIRSIEKKFSDFAIQQQKEEK